MSRTSIIIPCHNGAEYIGQTIGSVLEQTRPVREIIVVVDNSHDRSADIARSFGRPVKVCHVSFGMASKTRNFGAKLSSGDHLLFLDADDLLSPYAIQGLEDALEKQPQGIAYIPWQRLEQIDNKWVERPPSIPPQRAGDDLLAGWLSGRYYPPCCLLWSSDAFKRIGGWSEETCPNDDGDLAGRALVGGIPFQKASEGFAYYRRIPELASLSGQRFTSQGLRSRLRVAEKLIAWLEERGKVEAYQEPLACTFQEIHRDAREKEFSEIANRCIQILNMYDLERAAKRNERRNRIARLKRRARRNIFPFSKWPERKRGFDFEVDTGKLAFQRAQTNPRPLGTNLPTHNVPQDPAVSVIIPTYNRAQLVVRAIESVRSQSLTDIEILVIDDASTDQTEAAVAGIEDSRIRYFRQQSNQDVSAARNRGLREARGRYIAFLDSDDEWLPGKLEAQIDRFETLPESVGLVYTGSVQRYDDGTERVFTPEHKGKVLAQILRTNITDTGSASVVIRRNVIRVVGFFDETIPAMEDYDYWIRVARFYEFDFVPQVLARYHESHSIDRRSRIPHKDKEAREQLFAKYHRLYEQHELVNQFHTISADRLLQRYQVSDRKGALRASLKAIGANPRKRKAYRLSVQSVAPRRIWPAIRNLGSLLNRNQPRGV
ncbi:glycosyltransferase [Pelagicoccus sp. SDUM812002]|uniref:glycosyltransferase n=1 Tax=Pelagicoccus sp. SDUM812002 TaxID=3041266 RepID=UPI00280DB1A1|nr:glycosyltransferase [Pelagicoccus sp. SDUM812002]MDQ8184956.1 glycosyltransferase [Pelagicoccus sp. SDUM812002]